MDPKLRNKKVKFFLKTNHKKFNSQKSHKYFIVTSIIVWSWQKKLFGNYSMIDMITIQKVHFLFNDCKQMNHVNKFWALTLSLTLIGINQVVLAKGSDSDRIYIKKTSFPQNKTELSFFCREHHFLLFHYESCFTMFSCLNNNSTTIK